MKPKVTFSNVLGYTTRKSEILTFEKLERDTVGLFAYY